MNTQSETGACNMWCIQTHGWDLLSMCVFIKNIWDQPDLWRHINVTDGGLYVCTLRRTSAEEKHPSFKRISSPSSWPDLGAVFLSPSPITLKPRLCVRDFKNNIWREGGEESSAWTCLSLVIVAPRLCDCQAVTKPRPNPNLSLVKTSHSSLLPILSKAVYRGAKCLVRSDLSPGAPAISPARRVGIIQLKSAFFAFQSWSPHQKDKHTTWALFKKEQRNLKGAYTGLTHIRRSTYYKQRA